MQVNDRVKLSDKWINSVGINNKEYEKRIGNIVGFSGKDNIYTHVKWDAIDSVIIYHNTYIIKID